MATQSGTHSSFSESSDVKTVLPSIYGRAREERERRERGEREERGRVR